jgi:hypothetical protein
MPSARLSSLCILIGLGGLLGACAPPAAELAAQTAAAWTETPAPTETATSAPTATATATLTATATETPTPEATSTPTLTVTPSASPTPTSTPLPPPTLTFTPSPRPPAPVYPQTIIHPFDANDFRKELDELVRFNQRFITGLRYLIDNNQTGSCYSFFNYRNELVVSQAGYSDVPDAWYGLYYQYRVLVHESVNTVGPITSVCDAGGGTITLEQDLAIIDGLTNINAQVAPLQAQAAALP